MVDNSDQALALALTSADARLRQAGLEAWIDAHDPVLPELDDETP